MQTQTGTAVRYDHLQRLAGESGLKLVGVTTATPLLSDRAHLERWQAAGFAGELKYMLRSSELLGSPTKLLPSAKTVCSFAIPYAATPRQECPSGFGRIARYAVGADYHQVIKERLLNFVTACKRENGSKITARVFVDAVPLLERAIARQAGLGFIGKNTLLIRPGSGSFLFLGEVVWNLEISELPSALPTSHARCGSCRRCLDLCPTRALVGDKILDARRCISYLTIEKRGSLTWDERELIGEWLFGCDRCQEVCPHNHLVQKNYTAAAQTQLDVPGARGTIVALKEILALRSEEEFEQRFGGSAISRIGRAGLVRNACIVCANTLADSCQAALLECLHDDAALVRQHALWALWRLSRTQTGLRKNNLACIMHQALGDSSAQVVQEARLIKETGEV